MPPEALTAEPGRRWPRLPGWIALMLGLLVVVAGVWPAVTLELDPDIAWLLHAAGRVLDGGRYGVDVVEVNPPLILWYSMVAVEVARFTGISAPLAYHLIVALLVAGSSAAVTLLFRRYPAVAEPGLAGWLGLIVLFLLALPAGVSFGQREHLAVVLTLPYTVVTGLRLSGVALARPAAVGSGVAAALGFALKPYFLVPLALVEVSAWVSSRFRVGPFRPEALAVAATGLLYAPLALLLHPEWARSALELAPLYRAYIQPSLRQVLDHGDLAFVVAAVAALCWLALRPWRLPGARLSTPLAALGIGFTASALLQWKIWHYLFVPIGILAALLLVVLAVETWRAPSPPSARVARALAVLTLGLHLAGVGREGGFWAGSATRYARAAEDDYRHLVRLVRQVARGRTVAVLAANHGFSFPLVLDAGVQWPFRYPSLWPLTAIHRAELVPRAAPILAPASPPDPRESAFLDALVEDLRRDPPAVLVVPRPDTRVEAWGYARFFDYLTLLGTDPRLRELLSGFHPVDSVGFVVVYGREESLGQAP